MYKNILVPVLLDHPENAKTALEIANAVKAGDGKITLLHVVEEIPGYVASQLPEGTIDSNMNEARERLKALAADQAGGADADVVEGHASRTILDYAEKAGTDLVIIASHKPGLEDYLIGSTAGRVVRHAKCCVHVLR